METSGIRNLRDNYSICTDNQENYNFPSLLSLVIFIHIFKTFYTEVFQKPDIKVRISAVIQNISILGEFVLKSKILIKNKHVFLLH